MTNSFGQRSKFAIEFSLSDDCHGVWMYGSFRYWCGGHEVGDFGVSTSLRDVLFSLEGMRRDIGARQNPSFWNMSAVDMFRLLDAGLYGSGDPVPSGLAEDEQWARHNVTPNVDIFDYWKIFLVENEAEGRVIFSRAPYLDVSQVGVDAGDVDAVLESARVALEDIYERELAK